VAGPRTTSLLAVGGYAVVFGFLFASWFPAAVHKIPVAGWDDAALIVWVLAWVAHGLATDPRYLLRPRQVRGSKFDAPGNRPLRATMVVTARPAA
jgi:hypothetical protein